MISKMKHESCLIDNLLITIMLCILTCHTKSYIPQVVIGCIMLMHLCLKYLYMKTVVLNKNMISPLMWNICFALVSILSYFWAANKELVISIFPILFTKIIISLYCLNYMRNMHRVLICMRNMILAGCYMLFRIIGYMIIHPANHLNNATFYDICYDACGLNFNQVAQILAFCIIFSFICMSIKFRKRYVIFIAISYIIIYLTGSRKGIVMPFFGIMILALLKDLHSIKKQFKNIVLIMIIVVVASVFLAKHPILVERINIVINALLHGTAGDQSTTERLYFNAIAINMFMQSPIIGFGVNNFRGMLILANYNNIVYSHNNYLELASGLGVVGLVLYYWLYAKDLFLSFKKLKKCNKSAAVISLIVTFLVFEIGIVTYLYVIYMYVFLIAHMYLIYLEEKVQ